MMAMMMTMMMTMMMMVMMIMMMIMMLMIMMMMIILLAPRQAQAAEAVGHLPMVGVSPCEQSTTRWLKLHLDKNQAQS